MERLGGRILVGRSNKSGYSKLALLSLVILFEEPGSLLIFAPRCSPCAPSLLHLLFRDRKGSRATLEGVVSKYKGIVKRV